MPKKPPSPQSLYSGISLKPQKPTEKKEAQGIALEGYVRLTKRLARVYRGFGKGSTFTDAQQSAVDFLRLDITAEELYAGFKGILFTGIIVGVLATLFLYFTNPDIELIIPLATGGFFIIAGLGASYAYLTYPASQAELERRKALAYIPEIINYLVMNMRLTPNLERAVEFAANHGRGKIAEDFKRLIWDVQIGTYASIEEGLDDLAYRWGAYSDDFKHALMLVRASLLEGDAKRREELLEKASADVIEGSKEKMDLYARALHQPTVYLYYFGILLPLMLAIVLPIASGLVKNLPLSGLIPFILVYNVALPIGIYVLATNILGSRPPTYVAPSVPADFPGLPPRGTMMLGSLRFPFLPLALTVLIACIAAGFFLDQLQIAGIHSDYAISDKQVALDAIAHVKLPFSLPFLGNRLYILTIFGFLIGGCLFLSIYLLATYGARKKVQDEIRAMETEFKDALYILASRLGENRPMEDALRHAIAFLPKSAVANKIFKRVLENITQLGMTVDNAIFDPNYGAVRDVPSEVIRGGMRIMVDSVQLGVNVAATSLISLAMQIRNAQKIDEMLRRLLEDVTTMLSTMGTFIAPIVLGVVTSLQKIILNSLTANCGGDAASQLPTNVPSIGGLGGGGISQVFCNIDPKTVVHPGEFTLVLGIYVIEVVILLTYFNAQVEDANNPLHTYVRIATSLPIAIVIYCAVAYFASTALALG